MLNTIPEGTGRSQPNNVLDELLPLPSKARKETKSSAAGTGDTGVSSFEQMLTKDLQSRTRARGKLSPAGDAKAAPQVTQVTDDKNDKTDKEPAIDVTALLTGAGEVPMLPTAAKKDVQEKEKLLPVAGEIAPDVMRSLFTIAPLLPGTAPTATSSTPAQRGSDEAIGSSSSLRGECNPAPALQPTLQVETPSRIMESALLDKAEKTVAADSHLRAGNDEVNKAGGEERNAKLSANNEIADLPENGQPTPLQWTGQPEERSSFAKISDIAPPLTIAVENSTNEAAPPAMGIESQPEKKNVTGSQAAAPLSEAGPERKTVGLTGRQQIPSQWIGQPEERVPFTKSNGIAPLPTPAENRLNQAAPPATALNAQPEMTSVAGAGRQTMESPGEAGPEREAMNVIGRQQTPLQWIRQPEERAQFAKSNDIAPSTLPVENTANQAAPPATALNAQPEKTSVAGRLAPELPGKEPTEPEATQPNNIRESLVIKDFDKLMVSQRDAKLDPVMSDKGKSHRQSSAAPEIMDMNINRVAAPLSKGQEFTMPTTSLLAQVAEQLPPAISKGSGRIRISLEPDSLGKLDMYLVVRENRVQIVLTAESRPVQQTLQGHVEQLRDALQQQGLEVDGFNVFLQNGRHGQGDPASGGNPFWGEYSRAAADKPNVGDENVPAAAIPFLPRKNGQKGAEGINIFI
jgi:hypothetical protein